MWGRVGQQNESDRTLQAGSDERGFCQAARSLLVTVGLWVTAPLDGGLSIPRRVLRPDTFEQVEGSSNVGLSHFLPMRLYFLCRHRLLI